MMDPVARNEAAKRLIDALAARDATVATKVDHPDHWSMVPNSVNRQVRIVSDAMREAGL